MSSWMLGPKVDGIVAYFAGFVLVAQTRVRGLVDLLFLVRIRVSGAGKGLVSGQDGHGLWRCPTPGYCLRCGMVFLSI